MVSRVELKARGDARLLEALGHLLRVLEHAPHRAVARARLGVPKREVRAPYARIGPVSCDVFDKVRIPQRARNAGNALEEAALRCRPCGKEPCQRVARKRREGRCHAVLCEKRLGPWHDFASEKRELRCCGTLVCPAAAKYRRGRPRGEVVVPALWGYCYEGHRRMARRPAAFAQALPHVCPVTLKYVQVDNGNVGQASAATRGRFRRAEGDLLASDLKALLDHAPASSVPASLNQRE